MLFNSYAFIVVFLPTVVIGAYFLHRVGAQAVVAWLVAASLFFYGWWNPFYLILLVGSVAFNLAIGGRLKATCSRVLLAFGVAANLVTIGYFKYLGFFADIANDLIQAGWRPGTLILPLAISFFTFQQIAYLIDCRRGEVRPHGWLEYILFVTFFPQLIAGPIVRQHQILPQITDPDAFRLRVADIAVGFTIFTIGLVKKVVIADNLAVVVNPVFAAADRGDLVTLVESWRGALSYTFQLYFDFSGYSDMAIGLARLLGVRLPINFHSPYKAASITEFWRRWHMTLSGFLRDYLYFPLGGNRKGRRRRHVNLLVVMVLGGLWHGAAWTFVLWGALHGAYLLINHAWRAATGRLGLNRLGGRAWSRWTARLVTFLAVVAGWVLFRAESLDGAQAMLSAMAGFGRAGAIGAGPSAFEVGVLVTLLGIVFFAPNTQEIMRDAEPAWDMDRLTGPRQTELLVWKPSVAWGLVVAAAFLVAFVNVSKVREFLYFQF